MMETAENRLGRDCSKALYSPMDWTVLVQSPMGPHAIVIGGKLAKDPAQVSLSEYDQVVEAFAPDRADQPLRIPVLPWRCGRNRLVPNAHGTEPAPHGSTVNPILISN